MRKTIFLFMLAMVVVFAVSFPLIKVLADAEKDKAAIMAAQKTIDKIMPKEAVTSTNISGMIGKAISILLGIIGSVSLIIFLYSGIMWMTSGGNDQKVGKAQQSMIWAALGIFVVFISYILVKYVIEGVNPWS